MTKKQFFRSVAFLLVVAIMLFTLCDLFELENTTTASRRFYRYRHLSEDTVDAVIIGTSGSDRYWIPSQAYEEYGIALYPLCTDAFPSWLYINAIEDALEYQDVELFLIDIRSFGQDNVNLDTMDVRARRLLDVMSPFSVNRFKAALKTIETRVEASEKADKIDLSYFLSFIKYHSKWQEDDFNLADNLVRKTHEYMGFFVSPKATVLKTKLGEGTYDADLKIELDPISEKALYDLIDYVKANNIEVLFVDTPQVRKETEIGRSNTVYDILEQEGMNYISYYTEDSDNNFIIDLDTTTDFYNAGHVNFYGATKFTEHMAAYIDENYDLPDRREDENAAAEWDGVHEKLLEKITELENRKK